MRDLLTEVVRVISDPSAAAHSHVMGGVLSGVVREGKISNDFTLPDYTDGLAPYAPVPIPPGLDNYVIVRVWLSRLDQQEVGHVSLETPNEYISVWPSAALQKREGSPTGLQVQREIESFVGELRELRLRDTETAASDLFNEALGEIKVAYNTFPQDIDAEGRPPDTEILLRHLDVEKIEDYIRDVLRPRLNHWTLSGDTFSLQGILNKYFFLFDDGDSDTPAQSCASVVFNLLQIGGIGKLFNEYPNHSFLGRKIVKTTLTVNTALGVAGRSSYASTVAGKVQFVVNAPKATLGGTLALLNVKYGKKMLEQVVSDFETSKAKVAIATAAIETVRAILKSMKSSFKRDNVREFKLAGLIHSDPVTQREVERYSQALNSFHYLGDALAVEIKTPYGIDTLARIAYVLEQQQYKKLEKEKRRAAYLLEQQAARRLEEERRIAYLQEQRQVRQLEEERRLENPNDSLYLTNFIFCMLFSAVCFSAVFLKLSSMLFLLITDYFMVSSDSAITLSASSAALFGSSTVADFNFDLLFNEESNATGMCFSDGT